MPHTMTVTIKSPDEIEKMRLAGKLAAEVLEFIEPYVKPGITTNELDKLCHDYIVDVSPIDDPITQTTHPNPNQHYVNGVNLKKPV